MNMRQSHTAVVERNQRWEGDFATEPYEVGWSHEAIFFVRILRAEAANSHNPIQVDLTVQISPDGIHWYEERSGGRFFIFHHDNMPLLLSFVRVSHYGGWLRLAGRVEQGRVWALVHLVLKA